MTKLAFVDTETTGLDPDRHEIWEVGLIVREETGNEHSHRWCLPVDLGRADSVALRIGRFHERHGRYDDGEKPEKRLTALPKFARRFASMTRGAHLVGAVVSFDEERLRKLLQANGACPEWHYHLVTVEALAAGFLARDHEGCDPNAAEPPWTSESLSCAIGVEPPGDDLRHTALGDAHWAMEIYDAVMAGQRPEVPAEFLASRGEGGSGDR